MSSKSRPLAAAEVGPDVGEAPDEIGEDEPRVLPGRVEVEEAFLSGVVSKSTALGD